eukprot:TRINITY_DN6673_c0_g1_i2.p2 TRINITY_DN6673_c0_g1~~TRINITY_DN6673_c0_g1_i2.p2  ORF type:complete len:108 (-),score=25.84 TRINITY_DN6673_c0_g1_i2:104-427(-)
MNNYFFKQTQRKFLRNKSDVLAEYMVGGVFVMIVAVIFDNYNSKLNPEDPAEDEEKNTLKKVHPQTFFQTIIKQHIDLHKNIKDFDMQEVINSYDQKSKRLNQQKPV